MYLARIDYVASSDHEDSDCLLLWVGIVVKSAKATHLVDMTDLELDLSVVEGSHRISGVLINKNLRFKGVNWQIVELLVDLASSLLTKYLQELIPIPIFEELEEIAHRLAAG